MFMVGPCDEIDKSFQRDTREASTTLSECLDDFFFYSLAHSIICGGFRISFLFFFEPLFLIPPFSLIPYKFIYKFFIFHFLVLYFRSFVSCLPVCMLVCTCRHFDSGFRLIEGLPSLEWRADHVQDHAYGRWSMEFTMYFCSSLS